MAARILRGAIVGASSLLGKELAEELNQSPLAVWDLTLLDAADTGGRIAPAADEALVIQSITAEAFHGKDVVFFAGDEATTIKFWKTARDANARVVDLTAALEALPGALLHSLSTHAPGALGGAVPDAATAAVCIAHPAAMMLGIAARRLRQFGVRRMAATVMEPASQRGSAGVEELQGQTVALLSFKPMVQDVFGAQVAFNLRASLGSGAKVDLAVVAARIVREAQEFAGDASAAIAVQVLQAPVFHGSTASVFVELRTSVAENAVREALGGEEMRVLVAAEDSGSNESVSGSGEIVVTVRTAEGGQPAAATRPQRTPETHDKQAMSGPFVVPSSPEAQGAEGSAFWLWMAADNLRLVARSAAISGAALAALRS